MVKVAMRRTTSQVVSGPATSASTSRQRTMTRDLHKHKLVAGLGRPKTKVVGPGRQVFAVAAASESTTTTSPTLVELPNPPLDIVFVSAEVAPWSKTGGLGDVVGGLPIELAKRGHRVMTVAPRCGGKQEASFTGRSLVLT